MQVKRDMLLSFLACLALQASTTSFAREEMAQYRIEGVLTPFVKLEKADLLISKSCAQSECNAKTALKRASTIGLDFSGGANAGAKICRNIGGDIVIGADDSGNQLSFCRFNDGSMVSSGSVYSAALKNDLKK